MILMETRVTVRLQNNEVWLLFSLYMMKRKQIIKIEVNGYLVLFKKVPNVCDLCNNYCQYLSTWSSYFDPRYPERNDLVFCDFCSHMIQEGYAKKSLVPIKGELEKFRRP